MPARPGTGPVRQRTGAAVRAPWTPGDPGLTGTQTQRLQFRPLPASAAAKPRHRERARDAPCWPDELVVRPKPQRGARRRNIGQAPPLPAEAPPPPRARPRIPAPSPTPRSCGGARALLIPCLPAQASGLRRPAGSPSLGTSVAGSAFWIGQAERCPRPASPCPARPVTTRPLQGCGRDPLPPTFAQRPAPSSLARAGRGPGSVRR